jgi:ribonuclease HI
MTSTGKPFVQIFADGACSGNPGPGGFAAILVSGKKEKVVSGSDPLTTNNRMELLAVISALEALKRPCSVRVTTDSNYVVKGMTEWIQSWMKNGWRNSQKKDVLNRDLWERMLKAVDGHDMDWEWIKGHNGHPENERCDELARAEITALRKGARS